MARVRKARRRSTCPLCHGPIQVGQQVSDAPGNWAHTSCLVKQKKVDMEISYGEVGHDPPVHAVNGPWQGPPSVSRHAARNTSLCGRPLSRMRKNAPTLDDLCRKCEALMSQPAQPPAELFESREEPPMPATDFQPEYVTDLVPLSSLFVDPTVQRPMQEPWSKKIAAKFSPQRFADNPPKVSLRPAGRRGPNGELYHVMDGQHEIDAARQAGFPPDTLVPVHIYRGLSAEQEAVKFLDLNVDRKVVKAISRFPVSVLAGDPQAVAVADALEHYGWQAKSSGAEGGIACVVQLQRLAANPDVLDKVMRTITGAWGVRPGIQGVIVSGFGRIYSRPRSDGKPCDVDIQHMINRLKTVSPGAVIREARDRGNQSAPAAAANYVIREYNKYLRTSPRLDLIP